MCIINDGYIIGAIAPHQKKCGRCGQQTRCIDIADVTMPAGFSAEATILWNRDGEALIPCVGIGCGDYAKFHRQVAHIVDSRMHSGHAV